MTRNTKKENSKKEIVKVEKDKNNNAIFATDESKGASILIASFHSDSIY